MTVARRRGYTLLENGFPLMTVESIATILNDMTPTKRYIHYRNSSGHSLSGLPMKLKEGMSIPVVSTLLSTMVA